MTDILSQIGVFLLLLAAIFLIIVAIGLPILFLKWLWRKIK